MSNPRSSSRYLITFAGREAFLWISVASPLAPLGEKEPRTHHGATAGHIGRGHTPADVYIEELLVLAA